MKKGFLSPPSDRKYMSTLPACGSCGLYKNCNSPKMKPHGRGDKKILVVAECPGRNEDKQGVQLIGDSGQLLRRSLKKLGIKLDRDCWKTNAITCFTDGNTPTDKQIQYCRPNLLNTIKKLDPNVIILLGATAVKSLIGHLRDEHAGGISKWVGWKIPSIQLNSWICPTYHPSYLLRTNDPVLQLWFDRHLESAFQLDSKPHVEIPDYSSQVECVLDSRKTSRIIGKFLTNGGPVAFDFETDRLKPDHAEASIVCCAVCWQGKRTISFPWVGEAVRAAQALLSGFEFKYGWNIKFEQRWFRKIIGNNVYNFEWDGMIASHVLNNTAGITSLKFQSFVNLGLPDYSKEISPFFQSNNGNERNSIRDAGLTKLLKYCGLDALMTYKLIEMQRKEMGLDY